MAHPRRDSGQATVEFVAILPLAALLILVGWQLVVAGRTLATASSAARGAARASALGENPEDVARRYLPAALRRTAQVRETGEGTVEVRVDVPLVVGARRLVALTASAHFERQGDAP